jgi:hypothetical protein
MALPLLTAAVFLATDRLTPAGLPAVAVLGAAARTSRPGTPGGT